MYALTDRDALILAAYHRHEDLASVAKEIGLSRRYVRNLLIYIREELGVKTTLGAVVKAHRLGLVPIEKDDETTRKPPRPD